MEPVWIGVSLILLLIFVVLCVFLLFFNEQSFEEAVALQKASNETLYQNKTPVVKALRHRKKPKKEKSRNDDESGQGIKMAKESEAFLPALSTQAADVGVVDVANFSPESSPERTNVITESSEEEKPVPKASKKKSKGKSGRSPDGVKEQQRKEQTPSPRTQVIEETVVQEIFQKTEAEPVFESEPPMVPEEVIVPDKEHSVHSAPSKRTKKPKSSREKNISAESSSFQSCVDNLDSADLYNDEIQNLVDILLDKQKTADQWKTSGGKPDLLELLKKQLSEKEDAYQSELSRADKLANETKGLRDELRDEKSKHKNTEVTTNQKIQSLEKESDALLNRMRVTQENHSREIETLAKAVEECTQNHGQQSVGQQEWRKVQEELSTTKDCLHRAEGHKASLETRITMLEGEANKKVENENLLMKQTTEANDKLKNFDILKNSLSQQLQETVRAKAESEQRLVIAKKELVAARGEKSDAVKKAGELETQLDSEKSGVAELRKMFKALDSKVKETEKVVEEKEVLIGKLESDSEKKNDTKLAELQKQSDEISRHLEELKTKLAQAEEEHGETKQALTTKEQELAEHQGEIHSLKSSNSGMNSEIEALKNSLSEQKQSDEISRHLEELKTKLAQAEEEHGETKQVLTTKEQELADHQGEIHSLKSSNSGMNSEIEALKKSLSEQKQSDETSRHLEELKTKLGQAEEEHGKTKQALTTKEQELGEHQGEIHSLKSSNSDKDSEIEVLKKSLSEQVSEMEIIKNNVVEEEVQATPFDVDDERVKSLEEELEKLKTELGERKESAVAMEKSIDVMKAKNNELREKNWKAMDAVSAAEKQQKAALGKAVTAVKAENKTKLEKYYSDIKVYLCTIHPNVAVDEDLPYDEFLKEYENKTKELGCGTQELIVDTAKTDELETELSESLKKNEDLAARCETYTGRLAETEKMLHELQENVEKEIASLKETIQKKESELKEMNQSVSDLKDNVRKAEEASNAKDSRIVTLSEEVAELRVSSGNADDRSQNELKKLSEELQHSREQTKELQSEVETAKNLKETLQNKESELQKVTASVSELQINFKKAEEESNSKDTRISSLEGEVTTLRSSAESSADSSAKELKKISEELERSKETEKGLQEQLAAAKNEGSSSERERYKKEASDAAKVNAELRKEVEEVRIECGELQSTKTRGEKDDDQSDKLKKENDEKVRALEEKLALATKTESDLHAKISSLEDSKSTTSVDEELSPDKKKKGLKGAFSFKSKKDSKYKDITERYENARTESDQKSTRIAELETKLQQSENSLQVNEQKVKELTDNLQKARDSALTNGGVQSAAANPLNESQMKQMAEAMKDGDVPGNAV